MNNYRYINRKPREYICGIYKITNPKGSVYIGQSTDIKYRWSEHKRKKNKKQPKLHNSFEKYSRENHRFEILHELPFDIEQEVINRYEILYSELYRKCGINLLNLREGKGYGRLSDKTKNKISETLKRKYKNGQILINKGNFKKGHIPKNKGKTLQEIHGKEKAEEIKRKIKNKREEQIFSKESIEKRRKSLIEKWRDKPIMICNVCCKSGRGWKMKSFHFKNCKR